MRGWRDKFCAAVKQQQTFQHRIEKHLLLRLGVQCVVLLLALKILHVRRKLPLILTMNPLRATQNGFQWRRRRR